MRSQISWLQHTWLQSGAPSISRGAVQSAVLLLFLREEVELEFRVWSLSSECEAVNVIS